MFLSRSSALDRVLRRNTLRLPLMRSSRFVLCGDLHRGTGDRTDAFRPNRELFETVLRHYFRGGFVYIELGDGDELSDHGRLDRIVAANEAVFRLLDGFHRKGRLVYLYGNRNLQMKNSRWRSRHLRRARRVIPGLFEDLAVAESLRLGDRLFLLHGHQADVLSTFLIPLSRLILRAGRRSLRWIPVLRNLLSVSQNPRRRVRFEEQIRSWAGERNMTVVMGHTHLPAFPGRPHYLNCGSGVRPGLITALEIDGPSISLVEWQAPEARTGSGRIRALRRVAASRRLPPGGERSAT